MQYVHQSGLGDRLPELMGKRLACDCSLEEVCEADILAGSAQPARRKAETRSSAGMGRFAGSGCQSSAVEALDARGSGELLLGPLP